MMMKKLRNLVRRRKRVERAEYWRAPNAKWYFHRVGANGKLMDPSQGYSSASSVRRAIQRRWSGIEMRRVDR